jgi:formylglycine-generating enzyme required for sulfatase activity
MHGNVLEWIEDCVHVDYNGAPQDGSPWIENGNCGSHVVRGGSWFTGPQSLRAASRSWHFYAYRLIYLGFRVGRTLTP